MKNYESVGFVIGAIVGAVLTGIFVYFTKSPFAALMCLVSTLFGGWIGKSIPRKNNNVD